MKGMNIDTGLALAQHLLGQTKLMEVQEAVFRGVWIKQSYQDIIDAAAEHGYYYSLGHLRNTGSELWQALTDVLGERVTKNNLPEVLSRYQQKQPPDCASFKQDLGEVVDVSWFYGRSAELATLRQEIVVRQCRILALVGVSGVGKTALAAKWVQEGLEVCREERRSTESSSKIPFQGVFWRSLRHTPAIDEIMEALLQFVSDLPISPVSTLDQQISQLLNQLRQQRYLIVLDDWESLLQEGLAGYCTKEHEGYSRLLKRLAEEQHQSCLLLISREQPIEIAPLVGAESPVALFKLKGLTLHEAEALLLARGFSPGQSGLTELIQVHRGNPAALKITATTIQELFDGRIAQFLAQTSLIVGDVLTSRLDQQFERLSEAEKTVMYWLASAGQAVSLTELKIMIMTMPRSQLLSALESLRRRCLIERAVPVGGESWDVDGEVCFTLEPVLLKYVIQQLITQICQDICRTVQTKSLRYLGCLSSQALVQAQHPHTAQHTWMLCRRIQAKLESTLEAEAEQVAGQLKEILLQLQARLPQTYGFAETNLLKLLEHFNS